MATTGFMTRQNSRISGICGERFFTSGVCAGQIYRHFSQEAGKPFSTDASPSEANQPKATDAGSISRRIDYRRVENDVRI